MEQDKAPVAGPEDDGDSGDSDEMAALAKEVGEDEAEEQEDAGPAEERADKGDGKDPAERTVPHGALHEERKKRQALAQEVAKLRESDAKREAAFQKLLADQRARQEQQAPAPDFDTNPAEWLKHQLETTGKTVQQLQAEREAEQKRNAAIQSEQQFIARVQAQEAEYTKEAPDYPDAVTFLRDKRIRMFELAGMSQQEAAQAVYGESLYYSQMALQQGRNPAEVFYSLAREYGFTGPKKPAPAAEQKLEKLAKGQEKSSRMSAGGESAENTTLAQLAELDGEEFDKEWNRLKRKGLLG